MDAKEKKGTLNTIPEKESEGHKNNEGAQQENKELKAVIEKYIAEARESWEAELEERIKSEREDAARLASMSSEERAKVEMEKRQKDFETERQQYICERAEFDAAKELASQDLPVNFARVLANADRNIMLDNISRFKAEYMKAIEAGISQRLRGTLPKVSKNKEQTGDPFLSGLGM